MPQRKSGLKELAKSHTRRMHNLDIRTDLKHSIKNFLLLVEKKDKAEAHNSLKVLQKKLDKAAKRNVIHKNTASRRKSRFSLLLKKIA